MFEGGLYIQTEKKKEVSKQIHLNPYIEICAYKDNKWVRLACKAIEDDRKVARRHMLEAYPELKEMYQEDDGNTEVFRLSECSAIICSFNEAAKIYKF